jgi:hypothetical protein
LLKPWQHDEWCLPEVSGEFVAAMEDVLTLYSQPYDPSYPTVCLDEKPVVLHADLRPTLPLGPNRPERRDFEYERCGTANLFMMVEPLAGWRHVEVTERRTKQDYARCLQWLVEVAYPTAEYICVVQTTSTLIPLARSTRPFRAQRRAVSWPDWSSTTPPKHGS